MDIVTYKLSQKYADKVAAGFSSVRVDGLNIIFTLNDGKTATVAVPAPKDGVSITNVSLNQQNHLICTLSDGTAIDAGLVPQGVDGRDAKINGVNTLTIEAGDNITLDQEGNILTINSIGGGSGGTSNYNALTNKPKINNVELRGNKSLNDLGIQPAGNYITKAVNDLENYYIKTETFTKQEVNNLISAITTMDIQVVQTLPVQDISTTTIYLVPKTTAGTNDAYDEYIYVSNNWEHIGSTEVNLTNYVTFDDYATAATTGVVKTSAQYGVSTSSYTKNLTGSIRTYDQYQTGNDVTIICKGTLENVITGKNLETSNNKVTSISSSSTNTEYPSAKAVYDYIQSLNGDEVNY